MEQFGARAESPLDVCLKEVGESKIYVGIFAMRYGSIPDGYDKSFTHLEYEEAQRLQLPSLIFIFDEKTAILPAYVDRGDNAVKLAKLKEQLKASTNKHTCDFFSTPDDLASKVATAVANQLRKLEKSNKIEVEDGLEDAISTQSPLTPDVILKRANVLPMRWDGVEFIGVFYNAARKHGNINLPQATSKGYCEALRISYGHSVTVKWASQEKPQNYIDIYASNELADQVCDIDDNAIIKARMEVAYLYIDDDCCHESKMVLRIKEILQINYRG